MSDPAELSDASAPEGESRSKAEQAELQREDQSPEQPAHPPSADREHDGSGSASQLQEELDTAKAQADEYLDGWQRARAEFANYKKRMAREQEDARSRIAGDTITKYLGVVDDLERALRERPTEGEAAAWSEGIELIYRKLLTLLESEGVREIQALGEQFDPNLHEALSHEQSDEHQEGEVIEVVQKGYRMGERVLRPALVRVAK